jgi:hypothetical protein
MCERNMFFSATKENSICQGAKAYKKKAFENKTIFPTLHEFHPVTKTTLMTELLYEDMCRLRSYNTGLLCKDSLGRGRPQQLCALRSTRTNPLWRESPTRQQHKMDVRLRMCSLTAGSAKKSQKVQESIEKNARNSQTVFQTPFKLKFGRIKSPITFIFSFSSLFNPLLIQAFLLIRVSLPLTGIQEPRERIRK